MKLDILKAIDPHDLIAKVERAISIQYDLYTPLFVSHEGLLCQRVVGTPSLYEYHLIIAQDLDDLALQEQNLSNLGFDFIFNTVMWNAKYLQWMCRVNSKGLTVRDAVARLKTDEATGAYLSMVEDARASLRLAPMPDGKAVATIPFPVKFS